MHEFELINKYFSKLTSKSKASLKLNDDVFFEKNNKLVVSVDTYINGQHFFSFKNPDLVIKKIIRSSISDLICKGVKPKYYLISGSGNKKNFNQKTLKIIRETLRKEQKKYEISLVGGDTTNSKVLSFTFVVFGYSDSIPTKRHNAKLNDDIYVTGNLGDSYIGLKVLQKKISLNHKEQNYFKKAYYFPKLCLSFSKKISPLINTSIDISDGLYQDMNKLIEKGKSDFEIDILKIPISNNLKKVLLKNKIKKIRAVSKGDDYQILFTSNKKYRKKIRKISKLNKTKVTRIGIIKSANKSKLHNLTKNRGYNHHF